MIIQAIVNIAEICAQHGITQAVICPGSRSAAITLAFARHPKISTFVIPDERSAGFIALGMAQSSAFPVVIICTSGTAVANLYPAIIEAFYQQVPLIVLTADRPPEWIDQKDGQTIRQQNIFQHHIRSSFQFPVSFEQEDAVWHAERIVSEAIILSNGKTKGPVHINIPIREPFYPSQDETFHYSKSIKIIKAPILNTSLTESQKTELIKEVKKFGKIMVLAGQHPINKKVIEFLNNIQKHLKWVIIGDVISNIHHLEHSIIHHDIILGDPEEATDLKPDLLLSFGNSVLSKQLKSFIRSNTPAQHWHIEENETVVDTFNSLTKKIPSGPEPFFKLFIGNQLELSKTQNDYFNHWKEKDVQANLFLGSYLARNERSEFHVVKTVLANLPSFSTLHLANSMPVRYVNYLGIDPQKEISVWSNRGTSGIDGCLSTVVGHAHNSSSIHTLITGDMAFFYDRNALWHNHIPANLRIVILNNHGGGIFRLINGPKELEELEEFFEMKQKLNAANTARDFGMNYYTIKTMSVLPDMLEKFFSEKSGASILEIETDPKLNQKVFEEFKHKSKQLWK